MCTVFGKLQDEKLIIGKSFDWVQYGGNICFVPSYRSYGVNTIGCCFFEQMGSDRAYEGMNEKGLFVSTIALPTMGEEDRELTPLKINSLSMVRFILERASNVSEAMHIVKSFTIDYRIKYGWPKVHYFFADTGNNIGIYEENVFEEIINLNSEEYRILTNRSVESKIECIRYNKVKDFLEKNKVIKEVECIDILSMVKQESLTAWSTIYDINELKFSVFIEQNFENKYDFDLRKCLNKGKFSVDFAELKLNTKVMKRKRNEGYVKLEIF
ncbi:linear amide C-N hydrolase [Clostridium cylindrosporum]|uniref:Putative choloylglycine hydrolase family protein n=1 Tax=Clostridium cylindrosporum DSM 605 TaxID=1121307 RepID=A0A0J8DD20_CLOCY|nr:linear amide C-N hydrolase [Clostridium cylindrosporum]KMT22148.1 putative choloylglycine hydrolase family protein [Clostridium cylindrosporum DSM 605]